jgi:Capsule polysaccharide export protein
VKGLTYQGHLNQFWTADFKPDMKLFKKFRGYLLENTQVNAVYYSVGGWDLDNAELNALNFPMLKLSKF